MVLARKVLRFYKPCSTFLLAFFFLLIILEKGESSSSPSSEITLPQHQEALLSWHSDAGLEALISPSERKQFDFPTLTPLSSDQMNVGFRGSASFDFEKTDPRPWLNLFKKLNNGLDVRIFVYGGSMTSGHGCASRKKGHYLDNLKHCAWQFRFIQWLRVAFPRTNIVHKSRALASSDSLYAMSSFRDDLERNESIDLAFFDPSMNDYWTYEAELRNSDTLVTSSNNILRLASQHHVAVVYLSVFMGKLSAIDDIYDKVTKYHGVPLLSYRSVVHSKVHAAIILKQYDPNIHVNNTLCSVFFNAFSYTVEDVHPIFQTHVVIAQFVSDFFEKAYLFYSNRNRNNKASLKPEHLTLSEASHHWASLISVRSSFGDGGDQESLNSHSACHPIKTLHSSLPSDQQYTTKKGRIHMTKSWKYKQDHVRKPHGWISKGAEKNDFDVIKFPVATLSGKITISYLKTYQNAGKFKFFLTGFEKMAGNFRKTSKSKLLAQPSLIPCCVKDNYLETFSVELDTFDNTTKTSVIVSRTFQFDVIGIVKVVLKRIPLSDEERTWRMGDKVKIVSVRSC